MSFNILFSIFVWVITGIAYFVLFYKLGVKRDWHDERIKQFLSSKKSTPLDLKNHKFQKHEQIYQTIYRGLRFRSFLLSLASYLLFAFLYPLHIFENKFNYVQYFTAVIVSLKTFSNFTFSKENLKDDDNDDEKYRNYVNDFLKGLKYWVIEDAINREREYFKYLAYKKIDEAPKPKKSSDYIGTIIYKLSIMLNHIVTDCTEEGINEKIREDLYDIIDYYLKNEELTYIAKLRSFVEFIYTGEGMNILIVNDIFEDERMSLLSRSNIELNLKQMTSNRRNKSAAKEIKSLTEMLEMF